MLKLNLVATFRKVVLANDQIYHVYNRGVERRDVFTNKRDYYRALETLKYYRFANLPVKLSRYLTLPQEEKLKLMANIGNDDKLVEIIAFCLMPNHFHFLLKQKLENGISTFTANFTNSYTKYFNTRHERVGPLFQGIFKAVRIESDEQLMHVSRYIHLNPVSSFLIEPKQLESYEWTSFPEYMGLSDKKISNPEIVLDLFPSTQEYKQFVLDQVDYARKLEQIKHLTLED